MKFKNVFLCTVLVATVAVAALAACSSDSSSSNSSSGGSSETATTETVTVHVSAANGGTVEDKTGTAKLAIPAGALEKDTDITLKISPKTGNAVVGVADFGPDGLKFLKPATLELKADASLATSGKSLALAMEDGDTFKALPGSTYANGVARANVEHFTKFSVILVDGGVVLVDPSGCQDARAKFVACGGDPKGTWTFADFCPDPTTAKISDPFKGSCPQFSGSIEFTSTREVTIDATTTVVGAGAETLTQSIDFPLTCAQGDGGGPSTCADISSQAENRVCTDKGSGQCHCEVTQVTQKQSDTPNTYSVNGSTWTGSDSSGEYCVSGDILYYKEHKDGGGDGLLYVLKRK